MKTVEIAEMVARFDLETALAHLAAHLAGGDELGEVSHEDACDALNSVCVHVARMQITITAADEFFDTREDLTDNDMMLAAAGATAEYALPELKENR